MLFSKAVVHGFYMLCYLSRQHAGSVTSARTLAKAVDTPPEHARKILMRLCAARLVTATNGRSGGYALTRSLEDISVMDVLDAIDSIKDSHNLQSRSCAVAPDEACSVQPGLADLRVRIRELLARGTLASLIGEGCPKKTGITGCGGCGK